MKIGIITSLLLISFSISNALFAAEISFLIGKGEVKRGKTTLTAESGMKLYKNDTVITKKFSLAVITLSPEIQIKMKANSRLKINTLSKGKRAYINLNLKNGGVFSRVNRKSRKTIYRISAKTTVAAVRGTEFYFSYGEQSKKFPKLKDQWLCVNKGSVVVRNRKTGQRVLVPAGKGIMITDGIKITDPKFYQWTTKLNWNMNPSEGNLKEPEKDENDWD